MTRSAPLFVLHCSLRFNIGRTFLSLESLLPRYIVGRIGVDLSRNSCAELILRHLHYRYSRCVGAGKGRRSECFRMQGRAYVMKVHENVIASHTLY